MVAETPHRRAVAFVDGQNLFHGARDAFGYPTPNYDVVALTHAVCRSRGWGVAQVRFYTGVPDAADNAYWHHFWAAKGRVMRRQGVVVYTRDLRYRNRSVRLPNGTEHAFLLGEEKGIDVRIALDVIRLAHHHAYDVGVLFSQDQDLSEVAREIRVIAREQRRWIKLRARSPSVQPVGTSVAWIAQTGSRSTAPCTTSVSIPATIGLGDPGREVDGDPQDVLLFRPRARAALGHANVRRRQLQSERRASALHRSSRLAIFCLCSSERRPYVASPTPWSPL